MATVKFNLRGKDETKPQTIYLIFRHKNQKLVYSTGFKVKPKYWNDDTYRVRNVTHVADKEKINTLLDGLASECSNYATDCKYSQKEITKDGLKKHLDIFTGVTAPASKTLIAFIDSYIEQSKNRINPATGKYITKNTLKKYVSCRNHLANYEKYAGITLEFKSITLDFYHDFIEYQGKVNNSSTNTTGKLIAILKAFLNAADAAGLPVTRDFKSSRFKTFSEEADATYLTDKEIAKIYTINLADKPKLDRVRDLFIVGCWTGLRFSDVTRLTPANLKGNFIEVEQQKTGGRVLIPLNPMVKAIWDKYGGQLPKAISNQKFNDYIKEVSKLAGINEDTHKGITKGGIKRSTKFEKWELVTSHTARRSFATNLYKSGFPTISIMKITGHKTEKAFMKYIKVTPEEHAKMLAAHWAKTSNNLRVV